jgi:hypothetical protein
VNAGDIPDRLVAVTSPDFDACAVGGVRVPVCVICEEASCVCDEVFPFGSAAYLARLDEIHGRTTR